MSAATPACPICGGQLRAGEVFIESSFLSLFMIGASYQHLWFRAADSGASKEKVVGSLNHRPAYKCATCEALVVPAKDQR